MGAPNVLILDEPTNDLDIATLTVLEDYLDSFQGIVITVSHDRYFLDRIVRRIFAFEEKGKIVQYEGSYTDWQTRMMQKTSDESGDSAAKSKTPSPDTQGNLASMKKNSWKQPDTRLKFSFKEQKDYEVIEDEIAGLEEKIEHLEKQMSEAATDFVKLNELTKEKELTQQQLEEKMDRWMYLEELKARIDEQGKA